jgi:hypothetical protein
MFSNGEDLSEYLINKYESNDFESIHDLIKDSFLSFIMKIRRNTILEILNIYKTRHYHSIFITLFPLVEGLIWDLSLIIHKNVIPIYMNDSLKSLQNKNCQAIERNIGNLLKNTNFDQFIDEKFIEYFCDEFYLERNPYLHGQQEMKVTKSDVIKKIATLDYVLHTMRKIIKTELFKKLDEAEIQKEIINFQK